MPRRGPGAASCCRVSLTPTRPSPLGATRTERALATLLRHRHRPRDTQHRSTAGNVKSPPARRARGQEKRCSDRAARGAEARDKARCSHTHGDAEQAAGSVTAAALVPSRSRVQAPRRHEGSHAWHSSQGSADAALVFAAVSGDGTCFGQRQRSLLQSTRVVDNGRTSKSFCALDTAAHERRPGRVPPGSAFPGAQAPCGRGSLKP